jgi:hypothetical protein
MSKGRLVSVAKGLAERILAPVNAERAFYFYTGIGEPTDAVARSLREFVERVKAVQLKSIEFHVGRGDFENWALMLGDPELVKSLVKLRGSGLTGEKLRAELVRVVQTRVRQLQRSVAK